jgi:hypothetical protein
MFRNKNIQCCLWPNIISWRPAEEWIRGAYSSKGAAHNFEDEFIDKTHLALSQTVNPDERNRLAKAIGDHLFEEFADIPLIEFYKVSGHRGENVYAAPYWPVLCCYRVTRRPDP